MSPSRTAAAPGFYRDSGLVLWPLPGFPGGCRKLTLAGTAIALKVSFLALPRTHTGGHEQPERGDRSWRACQERDEGGAFLVAGR